MAAKQDMNDFNDRLKRINDPRNNSYYDQGLGMHIPKKVSGAKIKSAKKQHKEDSLLGPFVVSVMVGAFCLGVGQLIRVRYFGLIESGTITLAVDLLMTLWVLMVITALIKRTQISARVSQVIGVIAMLVAGHNLFWRWPEQMAYIYTPAFAQYIQQNTQPPSVVIGSTVYAF